MLDWLGITNYYSIQNLWLILFSSVHLKVELAMVRFAVLLITLKAHIHALAIEHL